MDRIEMSQQRELDLSQRMLREHSRRTDHDWLAELRGVPDIEHQYRAVEALSQYLHVVAFNTLRNRQLYYSRLQYMDQDSISELAQDFVQETLFKLAKNEFEVLDQYQGKGKFTSWTAQIINNEIASELRKVDWARSTSLRDLPEQQPNHSNFSSPEGIAMNQFNHDSLHQLISQLPPKLCTALTRCILHEERAASVAADMGITVNAVYMLVYRAKQILKKQITASGFDLLNT